MWFSATLVELRRDSDESIVLPLRTESPTEHDPRGSVVARVFFSANPSVYAPVDQPLAHGGREKEMIQAHPLV